MKQTKWLAILSAAALLAGCAAQGASPVPFSADPAALARGADRGSIVLRIKVPKVRRARAGHRPDYVSPATQSMSLTISGPTKVKQTVNLTANSKGCKSTVTNTFCQLTITLKPGKYTATISTYDAVNAGGNALSVAQAVAFTVKAGSSNAIALTLSGIPHSIFLTPGSTRSRTDASGGIQLFGTAANRIIAEALDADGNAIVGPGSPTFIVSKALGTLSVSLTEPVATQPNIFTVTPPASFSTSNATLSVQAVYSTAQTNGCAQAGANCFGTIKVSMAQLVAIVSPTAVSVLQVGESAPFATIAAGAAGAAFDSTGNLYAATSGGIAVYEPPYTAAAFVIRSGVSNPKAVVFDSAGDLFVANCTTCLGAGNDSVTEYVPPLASTSVPLFTITTGISAPVALTESAANDLFVANVTGNSGTGSVTEYAGGTSTPLATVTNTVTGPNAIALDAANYLFVSNSIAGCTGASTVTVDAYAPPYNAAPTSMGITHVSCPQAVVVDNIQSRVFIANSSSGSINGVTEFHDPSGGAPTFVRTVTTSVSDPIALALAQFSSAGGDDVYVANYGANDVTNYLRSSNYGNIPVPIAVTAPTGLAVLP